MSADGDPRLVILLQQDEAKCALWDDAKLAAYCERNGFTALPGDLNANFDWFVTKRDDVIGVRIGANHSGVVSDALFAEFAYVGEVGRFPNAFIVDVHFLDDDYDLARSAHGDAIAYVVIYTHPTSDVLLSLEYSALSEGCPERLAAAMAEAGREIERAQTAR